MIPTFIKIPTASDHRTMTGYGFDDVPASVNREAYRRMYPGTEMELSERISDDIDGFYDGFDSLAITPDGQMYHVLFSWETGEPLIWCPIHPVQSRYMTDDQYSACVRECSAYTNADAYISAMALSSIWGDAEGADVPARRIEVLRTIYAAVNRPVRDVVSSSGLSQAAFAERYCIPRRTVENWCSGSRECPLYTRLLLQRAEGLLKV